MEMHDDTLLFGTDDSDLIARVEISWLWVKRIFPVGNIFFFLFPLLLPHEALHFLNTHTHTHTHTLLIPRAMLVHIVAGSHITLVK